MTEFNGYDCVELANKAVRLLVTRSVGPRIISLSMNGGDNLFAELPNFVSRRPDGKDFHFLGGHRLWHAPENMPRTYALDNEPVEIVTVENGLKVIQPVEELTGIQKTLEITLMGEQPRVTVRHMLTNQGLWSVECAPWAITQMRTGGVAILPQSQETTGLLPNRSFTLWPYASVNDANVRLGNRYIQVLAKMEIPFKVGFPNPRGWLGYWLAGTLFVKRTDYLPQAAYYDRGSSSECYCNDKFLELETLAPITKIEPGASVTHTETWELYANVDFPGDEDETEAMVKKLGLG